MASLVLGVSISWSMFSVTVDAQETSSSTFLSSEIFTKDTSSFLNSTSEENSSEKKTEEEIYIPSFDETLLKSGNEFGPADIQASLTFDDRFRTYNDPDSGVPPTMLDVALNISPVKAGINGAYVVLPLDGFVPPSDSADDNGVFKYFTTREPIFELVEPNKLDDESIFYSVEHDEEKNQLIVKLKETSSSVEAINLKFKFNKNYLMEIPPNQVIWEDIHAEIYDSSDKLVSRTSKTNVMTNNYIPFNTDQSYYSPGDSTYYGGNITLRTAYRDYSFARSEILPDSNKIFIEMPIGIKTDNFPFVDYDNGITNGDNPDVRKGSVRYYGTVGREFYASKLTSIHNYRAVDIRYSIPDDMYKKDDEFFITSGTEYSLVNGQTEVKKNTVNYKKNDRVGWQLEIPGMHSTDSAQPYPEILMTNMSDASRSVWMFGRNAYDYNLNLRNTGSQPIKGTKFTIYQSEEGHEKLNFQDVVVYPTTEDNSVDRAQYKFEIETKDAITGKTIQDITVPTRAIPTNYTMTLPTLGKNEYISRITAIPMGTKGLDEEEGFFPTLNSFSFKYRGKNWTKNEYPDETKLSENAPNLIPVSGKMEYLDQNNKPVVHEIESKDTYILPEHTYHVSANIDSSNSLNRQPGDIVDYSLQGTNGSRRTKINKQWINPEISFSIDKELELVDVDKPKDFIDLVNKKTYKNAVTATLISSDAKTNNYRLNAEATSFESYASVNGASFEIPLKFKIKEKTMQGTYGFNSLAVSNNGKPLVQSTPLLVNNNLSTVMSKQLGFDNSIPSSYSAMGRSAFPTSVTVARQTRLSGTTAGRGSSTDDWSKITDFAVEKGGSPQMQARIENTGNTNFSNTRIYNVLPTDRDDRGSTGNIAFAGVDSADKPTTYYTTKKTNELPDYANNKIEDWNTDKLNELRFTTTKPTDISKVTAIFIDFKETIIEPGGSLEVIMDFKVPNADNQKAVNQFQYSSKEVGGSNVVLNATSDLITFSTEIFTVSHNENLPKILAEGVEHPTDMAESQSVLLDASSKGSITISNKTPKLPGYTFDTWRDKYGGYTYSQGATIDYDEYMSTNTVLDAIWKPVKIELEYYSNISETDNKKLATQKVDFGSRFNDDEIEKPKRDKYVFRGWSSHPEATEPEFDERNRINFLETKKLYAVWAEKIDSPLKITDKATNKDNYITYVDPSTGNNPDDFTLEFTISNSRDIPKGYTAVLDLDGYFPDSGYPAFDYFTMQDPIFELSKYTTAEESTLIDEVIYDKENRQLIYKFNYIETPSVQNMSLRFKLNPKYYNKIPPEQVVWRNFQFKLYDPNGKYLMETINEDVTTKANSRDVFYTQLNRYSPSNEEYSNDITFRLVDWYQEYQLYERDESQDAFGYVDLPNGTEILSTGETIVSTETNRQNKDVLEGYTRHYYNITYNIKESNGSRRYTTNIIRIRPPEKIKIGEEFTFYYGQNPTLFNSRASVDRETVSYTKIEEIKWDLNLSTLNSTNGYNQNLRTVILNNTKPDIRASQFGNTSFTSAETTRNQGVDDITGFKVEWKQRTGVSQKEKLAIDGFRAVLTSDLRETKKNYWQPKYEIINAKTGDIRRPELPQIIQPANTTIQMIYLPPLDLNENEYIQSMTLVPMGLDGKKEGVLAPGNGVGIHYYLDNPGLNWPDGTPISQTEVTPVVTSGTIYYDDEDGQAKTFESNLLRFSYQPANLLDVTVSLLGSNTTNQLPGTVLDYRIQGANPGLSSDRWRNPEVTVAIPNQLELVDETKPKDFYDEVNEKNYPDVVSVKKLDSLEPNDKFTYYRFNAEAISELNDPNRMSFSIPIKLKIKEGTRVGQIDFDKITASTTDNDPVFAQRTKATNNLSDTQAKLYGYDNSDEQLYSSFNAIASGNELTIGRKTDLTGRSAGRPQPSDDWADTKYFPVDKGGTPEQLVAISNKGNTQFNNVRIYDILPKDKDERGSTGGIEFTGAAAGAGVNSEIYYTTMKRSKLPDYGGSLDWSGDDLEELGFTKTPPSNLGDVTAIYVNFGSEVVQPLKDFQTILTFKVPNADNQVAVNTFQYTATEIGTGDKLNATSPEITFSTQVASIMYDENLPEVLTEETVKAGNMPEDTHSLLEIGGSVTLKVSDKKPTVPGYTFDGWVDKDNTKHPANEEVDFDYDTMDTFSRLNLKATWKPNNVNINYYTNITDTDNTKIDSKIVKFGTKFDLDSIKKPKKTGYTFMGWSEEKGKDNTVDLDENSLVNFEGPKDYFAVWKANDYKVYFDKTTGDEGQEDKMPSIDLVYDAPINLPKNTFTKDRYKFIGWSRTKDGEVAIEDEGEALNLTTKPDDKVILYAQWERIMSKATVEYRLYQDDKLTDITIMTDKLDGIERVETSNTDDLIGADLLSKVTSIKDDKDVAYGYTFYKYYYADPDDNNKIKEITSSTKVPKNDNYTIYLAYKPRFNLEVPQEVNFPEQSTIKHRKDVMLDFDEQEELNILNTYETSAGPNAFTVSARTSNWLTNNNHQLDSLFYYKTPQSTNYRYINTEFVKIEDYDKVQTKIPLTSKNEDKGLGIRIFGDRTDMDSGKYDGEIEWQIQFAP